MTSRHAFWRLIAAAIGLALADAVFTAVTVIIWPAPAAVPAWQARVFSIVWLAALLLTATAGLGYVLRKRREP